HGRGGRAPARGAARILARRGAAGPSGNARGDRRGGGFPPRRSLGHRGGLDPRRRRPALVESGPRGGLRDLPGAADGGGAEGPRRGRRAHGRRDHSVIVIVTSSVSERGSTGSRSVTVSRAR